MTASRTANSFIRRDNLPTSILRAKRRFGKHRSAVFAFPPDSPAIFPARLHAGPWRQFCGRGSRVVRPAQIRIQRCGAAFPLIAILQPDEGQSNQGHEKIGPEDHTGRTAAKRIWILFQGAIKPTTTGAASGSHSDSIGWISRYRRVTLTGKSTYPWTNDEKVLAGSRWTSMRLNLWRTSSHKTRNCSSASRLPIQKWMPYPNER